MNVFEEIASMSEAQMQEYSWPRVESLSQVTLTNSSQAIAGDLRTTRAFFGGLGSTYIATDQISLKWNQITGALRRTLSAQS